MEKKKMFDLYHMVDNLNLLTWQAFDSVALATVLIFDSTFPNCSLLTRPHLTSEPVEWIHWTSISYIFKYTYFYLQGFPKPVLELV